MMRTDDATRIGAGIRAARLAAGLTEDDLARRVVGASLSEHAIAKFEGGEIVPSPTALVALAAALGVAPQALFSSDGVGGASPGALGTRTPDPEREDVEAWDRTDAAELAKDD